MPLLDSKTLFQTGRCPAGLYFAVVLLLCASGFSQSASKHDSRSQQFYYYGRRKILLTPVPSTLAAKVQPGVSLANRFPHLEKYFNSIAPSAIGLSREVIVSKGGVSPQTAGAAMAPAEGTKEIAPVPVYRYGQLLLVVQNEVLVSFKPTSSKALRESLLRKFSTSFKELVSGTGVYALSLGNPSSTLDVSKILHGNRYVETAEPNFLVISTPEENEIKRWVAPEMPPPTGGPLSPTFPQDRLFNRQWSLENRIDQSTYGKEKADIRVKGAWDITKGSDQVRVAVLDDGIDVNQPDLKDQIATENGQPLIWDVIADSPVQSRSAGDTHGTHVAGVIAARTNNVIGIAGVAPGVRLIPIRMGSNTVKNWTNAGLFFKAIYKAVEFHADVINGSFFFAPSAISDSAIDYALKTGRGGKGVIMVFADGKGGPVLYPATQALIKPVIAVGATNSWDQVKTANSNDGEITWASSVGPEVTVVAPGVGITTTDVSIPQDGPEGKYIFDFEGTSSAAPHVAGLVALLLSLPAYNVATAEDVREQIIRTADKIDGSDRTNTAGWGRVNACRAVSGSECD